MADFKNLRSNRILVFDQPKPIFYDNSSDRNTECLPGHVINAV